MAVQGHREPRGQTIPALLAAAAALAPDAPALLAPGGEHVSFGLLLDQTRRVAGQLRSLGIQRSDRVAIVHPNGPELAGAFLGVASAAVCAPLNPSYRPSEIDFYLADLDAKAILVGPGEESPVRDLATRRGIRLVEIEADGGGGIRLSKGRACGPRVAEPDDTALVLHTSGTTARPKLVPLTHGRLVLSARNVARTLALTPDDRCLNVMPLFHIHAIVGTLLSSLSAGASVVCAPRFHAPSFHRWLAETGPTWYSAVPTMHQAVLERARELDASRGSTLRLIRSSSAPLPPRVYESLGETFGVPVIEAYGMTEAAHQMTSNPLPPGERKAGSVGIATHIEVGVRSEDGRMLGAGKVGEIVIRGETVFAGYEANREANAEAFVDGWFRTGDEGSLDEDGYLFLRGRTKEIINRAGEKVSPGEVEDVLLRHPDVAQAVSFAVAHERLGEDVGAAVVLRDGATATERDMQEHAAASLAHFKVPSVVMVVDEIPVGATGKLQRIGLAERLGIGEVTGQGGATEYVAPRTQPEAEIAAMFAEVLHTDDVGVRDDFFDLGGDSILGTELVARLREVYDLDDLVPSELVWAPTVEKLAARIIAGRTDAKWSSLVELQHGSAGMAPLFCIHGLDGGVLLFAALARCLGAERPVYAFRGRGADGRRAPHATIEAMAEEYVEALRALRPHGPYYLAGACAGGLIALDMAARIRETGGDVPLIALFDPRGPRPSVVAPHIARRAATRLRNRDVAAATRILRRATTRVFRAVRRMPTQPTPRWASAEEVAAERFRDLLAEARDRYEPSPLDGMVVAFSSQNPPTPRAYWDALADDRVVWRQVDASHRDLLKRPHVETIGKELASLLDERSAG